MWCSFLRYGCLRRVLLSLLWASLVVPLVAVVGCSDDHTDVQPTANPKPKPDPKPTTCEVLMLPALARDTSGPFGILRHDVADDFTLPLHDGSEWTLSQQWSGCESYLFVTSARVNSALDDTSLWARDIDQLIEKSPDNVHYFFISNRGAETIAELDAMAGRIETALAPLEQARADWWRAHLHVVAKKADALSGWLATLLAGAGRGGFAIDRKQQIRLLGNLADVARYQSSLNTANEWPWESNLSYLAYEVKHYNYEARRAARFAAEEAAGVTIVKPWEGQVLDYQTEVDVTLPTAAEMADFDTLEIDLTLDCPDKTKGEFGNCGAWDYLAHLSVKEADDSWREVARFITSYHREGRYVVDATPLLVYLREGGMRRFRLVTSPDFNPQPYNTTLHLRFSQRGKPAKPTEAVYLWGGGDFNAMYNEGRMPIDVPISAAAKRVELWAIITGHGGATFNCAEFCNHQHEFSVNGDKFLREHTTVGDQEGCIGEVENGMVPNQGGTWWFGRGGWCPGQQVEPWVVDVTDSVVPGQTATIRYRGLFNSKTPPDDAGNIVMNSYLVVYQ